MSHERVRSGVGDLSDLLGEVDVVGWDSAPGRRVVEIIQRACAAAAARWVRRAGHLGEVGVGPAWVALAEWLRSDRHVDPSAVLRRTLGRVYAAEAAAVELGAGDPIDRARDIVKMVREPHAPRRSAVDLSIYSVPVDDEMPAGPEDRPAWLQVTAAMLVAAGWRWPQPAGECLAAMASETARAGRRSATSLARRGTGVPPQTWSALALLAAGSGPGCAAERMWPGVPAIHSIGGALAVRESTEVSRIIRAAVAGRPVRSGRAWLATGKVS